MQVTLAQLEDDLLAQLAAADPATILDNIPLIEGLESTKQTAAEISQAVDRGKQTEIGINQAREAYRTVAGEASQLYFMLLKLCLIDHMYQYSLESYTKFFYKGILNAVKAEKQERVRALLERERAAERDGAVEVEARPDGELGAA